MTIYIDWRMNGHSYTMTFHANDYDQEEASKKSLIRWIKENKERIRGYRILDHDNVITDRLDDTITKTLK